METTIKRSETIAALATALATFQSEVSHPKKSASVSFGGTSYKYATLDGLIDTIKAHLAKNGLSYFQSANATETTIEITTLLMHKSGEWIESHPVSFSRPDNKPQTIGSLITYGRRYGLSAALGIASEEDDDGSKAQNATKNAKPSAPKKVAEKPKESFQTLENDDDNPDFVNEAEAERLEAEKLAKEPISEEQRTAILDLAKRKGITNGEVSEFNGLKKGQKLNKEQFLTTKEWLETMPDAKQSSLDL
jgi:hypothetical protein